jgi:hypothetical protein
MSMFGPFVPGTTEPTTTTPGDVTTTDDVQGTLDPHSINPINDSSAFDYILLAGDWSPGIVTDIAGASNPRKWDERAGTGQSGATIVYSGDGLCKFTVKLLFWLPEHFAYWDVWKKRLVSPTEKNPSALDFFHPYTDMLPVPVRSVVVTDCKAPTQSGDGLWTVEIAFLQFRAPKPAGAKPGASKTGTGKKDEFDVMIDDLNKTMKDLAK